MYWTLALTLNTLFQYNLQLGLSWVMETQKLKMFAFDPDQHSASNKSMTSNISILVWVLGDLDSFKWGNLPLFSQHTLSFFLLLLFGHPFYRIFVQVSFIAVSKFPCWNAHWHEHNARFTVLCDQVPMTCIFSRFRIGIDMVSSFRLFWRNVPHASIVYFIAHLPLFSSSFYRNILMACCTDFTVSYGF